MEIQSGSATMNGKPLSPKAVSAVLIAVFILVNISLLSVLCIFTALGWKSIYLYFNGETADGVVVDFKFSGGMEPSIASVIEFTVNGQSYTFDTAYRDPQPNQKGDHLEVIYSPADPSIAQVNTFAERWSLLAIIAGSLCPSLLLVDIVMIFVFVIRKAAGTAAKAIGNIYEP